MFYTNSRHNNFLREYSRSAAYLYEIPRIKIAKIWILGADFRAALNTMVLSTRNLQETHYSWLEFILDSSL